MIVGGRVDFGPVRDWFLHGVGLLLLAVVALVITSVALLALVLFVVHVIRRRFARRASTPRTSIR